MFDLEQAIADWRRQMLTTGLTAPVPLDELEEHLREDFAREVETGLDAAQVFALVVERLGAGTPLNVEFQKANSGKNFFFILACLPGIAWTVFLFFRLIYTLAELIFNPAYIAPSRHELFPEWSQWMTRIYLICAWIFIIRSKNRTKQPPSIVTREQEVATRRMFLGFFSVLFACILIFSAGLLIYGVSVAARSWAGLRPDDLGLCFFALIIFFGPGCVLLYSGWKMIQTAQTLRQQLKPA